MRFYDFIIEKEIKESPEEVVEVKSKVFPQVYMGDQLMADDPMTAMELIADEVSEEDLEMIEDEVFAGDNFDMLLDTLDGFGYQLKFVGDPLSRYSEDKMKFSPLTKNPKSTGMKIKMPAVLIRSPKGTASLRNASGFNALRAIKAEDFIRETDESLAEEISTLTEKNIPTDKAKWSYYKSQAKKKFKVYPSAYANAWAAKKYKAAGGRWRKGKK